MGRHAAPSSLESRFHSQVPCPPLAWICCCPRWGGRRGRRTRTTLGAHWQDWWMSWCPSEWSCSSAQSDCHRRGWLRNYTVRNLLHPCHSTPICCRTYSHAYVVHPCHSAPICCRLSRAYVVHPCHSTPICCRLSRAYAVHPWL